MNSTVLCVVIPGYTDGYSFTDDLTLFRFSHRQYIISYIPLWLCSCIHYTILYNIYDTCIDSNSKRKRVYSEYE